MLFFVGLLCKIFDAVVLKKKIVIFFLFEKILYFCRVVFDFFKL